MQHFQDALRHEGRVVGFETRIRRKDDDVVWVALSAQLILDDEGNPHHLEGSVIDITERKLREDAEQATRVAEATTETKSQFLANMSHEIRTPMNAIIGYTDLTLRTRLNDQQKNYLETIRNSSNHLLRVVNDILDISKVESGKLELQRIPFRLRDIFVDLDNLFGLEAASKGVLLSLPNSDSSHEQYYLGDPVRIGQVLINLVSNAIKFTDEGEIKVELETISQDENRTCFNFSVSDAGIGIDGAELEAIFESFTQGSLTASDGGTGLGLAICKRLVEMMDGHIHAVANDPAPGSTFYFSLVADRLDELPIAVARNQTHPNARPAQLPGQKLLLVEDNQINQDLAREVLSQAGVKVTVANDGREAIAILEKANFVAVLMDIRMPVMDGLEAIRIIRNDERLKDMPVIALSAGVLSNEVEQALANGFDYYFTKPVNFDHVLNLLRDICGIEAPADHRGVLQSQQYQQDIKGVNFRQALRNHNNDEDLLSLLMDKFIDIYQYAGDDLNRHMQDGDTEKAERLAHNVAGVAGVAGSFGAANLMIASRELEHKLAAGELELQGALGGFQEELDNMVAAIKQFQADRETTSNSS